MILITELDDLKKLAGVGERHGLTGRVKTPFSLIRPTSREDMLVQADNRRCDRTMVIIQMMEGEVGGRSVDEERKIRWENGYCCCKHAT